MRTGLISSFTLQKTAFCLFLSWLLFAMPCTASGPPPVITVQPQSQSAPLLGIVTFYVTATSGTTMTYQWYKNGVAIPGATSSSYTILTVLGSDAGAYSVKVTNAGGSVMSDTAYLNIPPPPTINTQPQSQTVLQGSNVSFSVSASSSLSMTYQWYFNSASLGAAATSSTYSISNVTTGNAGSYKVVVANSTGGTTSQVATLTVAVPPSITNQPQTISKTVGQTATFTVSAGGTGPLAYQWHFNGTNLPGATASTLSLSNVQTNQAGLYSATVTNAFGSVDSTSATLSVFVPPAISTQPVPQTVLAGQSVSFFVVAGGSPTLTYQWSRNGMNLAGATKSTLTLTNVQSTDGGRYAVHVQNPYGSADSSSARLTVNVPPQITAQPQSITQIAGQSASFSVTVSGTTPLSYQWSFNGSVLPGATNSVLNIPSVDTSNAGDYSVVVTNVAGSAASLPGSLTVADPPTLAVNSSDSSGPPIGFTFQVMVPAGFTYVVLASTDLQNWAPIATNVAQSNPDVFTDTDSPNYPNRFYRIMIQ